MKFYSKLFVAFLGVALSAQMAFAYAPMAEAKYNQGLEYSEKGNYQMAVESFEEALNIDPTFADAYFNLGVLYEYLNKNDKAIMAFEELLKQNPTDSDAAFKIATLCYKQGQYKKALSFITLVSADSDKYQQSQDLYRKIVEKINQQKATATKYKAQPPTIQAVIKGFQAPTGVTKDSLGNLYVANYGDNSIFKITPDGKKSLIARGNPLNGPLGIAVDSGYNLYVANYTANNVLRIEPNGTMTVILKNIQKPYYLFLDSTNNLYISEQGSNSVITLKL